MFLAMEDLATDPIILFKISVLVPDPAPNSSGHGDDNLPLIAKISWIAVVIFAFLGVSSAVWIVVREQMYVKQSPCFFSIVYKLDRLVITPWKCCITVF